MTSEAAPREPLRVLWLVDSSRGGTVLPFAEVIDRAELQLRVCCIESAGDAPVEERLRKLGVPLTSLQARSGWDVVAWQRLVKLLRDERIQLVHAHDSRPIIWGVIACRWAKVPIVATLHASPTLKGGVGSLESLREWLVMELLRWPRSTTTATSEGVGRAFTAKYSLPQQRIRVIPNGISVVTYERRNPERAIELKQKFGLPSDARVVMTATPLRPESGVDILLRAFQVVQRSVPLAQLIVVGEGPNQHGWSRLADHLGVGDVHWAGARKDLPALLAGADLFVLPSREEMPSMVLLEAMAAELPILATQVGGIAEIVDSPAVGVLIPPRDPVALAREISRLLLDDQGRRALAVAARRRVAEAFPAKRWVDQLMGTYRETAGARRGAVKIAVVEFEGRGERIQHAFQLSRAMAQEGADVTLLTDQQYELETLEHPFRLLKVFSTRGRGDAGTRGGGRRVSASPLLRVGWVVAHYRAWGQLLSHLRDERYDVVQLGDLKFPTDFLALRRARHRTRVLTTICHDVRRFSPRGRQLYERSFRLFDGIFVHFRANGTEFRNRFPTSAQRLQVIVHGNQEIFRELQGRLMTENRIRTELGFLPDEPVVLYFGTLAGSQGLDTLVEAFAWVGLRHPRAQLVLTGPALEDFDAEKHQALARNLGVGGRVRIVPGAVAPAAVAAWMKVASVIVFPHREAEESANLQIAQTFGAPIVASKVGSTPEIIEGEVSGLLVPPNDADKLAHEVARLLEDRELARQLGEASRAAAEQQFSWRAVAQEMLSVYGQQLGRTGMSS